MNRLMPALVLLFQLPLMGQTLQLNVNPGDAFRSTTSSTQQIVQQMGDTTTEVRQQSTIVIRYTVQELNDTELILDMAFEHIRFEQTSPMGELVYDSDQTLDNPSPQLKQLSTTYRAMLDSSLSVVLDPATGRQIRMEGWDALMGRILEGMALPDEEMKHKLKDQLQSSIQDRMSAAGAYGVLPPVYGRPIQPGHSWSDQQTVRMMSDMNVDTTFTMERATPDTVTVRIASSLGTPADAPAVDMGFASMRYDLTGSQNGSITLDRKTGWATATSITHELEGELAAEGQGYVIPMNVTGTIQTRSEPIES